MFMLAGMKKWLVLCGVACLALACKEEAPKQAAPAATAQTKAVEISPTAPPKEGATVAEGLGNFEGEIALALKDKDKPEPTTLTLFVKSGQLRFDAPPEVAAKSGQKGKIYQIVNMAEGKVLSVSEAHKMVMEMDAKALADQMKKMTPGAAQKDTSDAKVSKTGKMDNVAGYKCEEWEITTKEPGNTKICVSNMSVGWLKFPFAQGAGEEAWAKEVFDGAHFPLRIVNFSADGKEQHRAEVTKIERKVVAAELFTIPADYKRNNMTDMMRSMGAMGAMMGAGGAPAGAAGAGAGGAAPFALPSGVKIPPEVQEMMRKMKEQQEAQKKPR